LIHCMTQGLDQRFLVMKSTTKCRTPAMIIGAIIADKGHISVSKSFRGGSCIEEESSWCVRTCGCVHT
jgi:hypothetical protein